MRRIALILSLTILIQLTGSVAWAQNAVTPAGSAGVAAGRGSGHFRRAETGVGKTQESSRRPRRAAKGTGETNPDSGPSSGSGTSRDTGAGAVGIGGRCQRARQTSFADGAPTGTGPAEFYG